MASPSPSGWDRRTRGRFVDTQQPEGKHNTDIDRCARSRTNRMNPDESGWRGLTSLALTENDMVA